jgi:hypothetical protein
MMWRLIVLTMLLATACSEQRSESAAGTGTWDESLAVGQSVTIVGEFMRNDPQAKCEYAQTTHAATPPKSPWDWIIRKDRRCMWVTGERRTHNRIFGSPDEILDKDNIGRKVEIEAVVASDATGRLYLAYTEGRPIGN